MAINSNKKNHSHDTVYELYWLINEKGNRPLAIKQLMQSRSTNKEKYLKILLENQKEDTKTISLAIENLASLKTQESISILRSNLDFQNSSICKRIIHSLGYIGTKDCLEILKNMSKDRDQDLGQYIDFSRILISHRFGISNGIIPIPRDLIKFDSSSLIGYRLSPLTEEINRIKQDLSYELIEFDISKMLSSKIVFEEYLDNMIILFDKRLESYDLTREYIKRNAIVGMIIMCDPEYAKYELEYVILLSITAENTRILSILTADGELSNVGTVSSENDSIQLQIDSTTNSEIFPVYIDITIKPDNSVFRDFKFSKSMVAKSSAIKTEELE